MYKTYSYFQSLGTSKWVISTNDWNRSNFAICTSKSNLAATSLDQVNSSRRVVLSFSYFGLMGFISHLYVMKDVANNLEV